MHVHVISYLYVCILPSYFHGVLEVVLLYLLRGRSCEFFMQHARSWTSHSRSAHVSIDQWHRTAFRIGI